MDTIRSAFWLAVIGVAVCLAFFFALGAIPLDATGAVAVMVALAVLVVIHFVLQNRRTDGSRDRRAIGDRERRGF